MDVTGMNEGPGLSVVVCRIGDTRCRIMEAKAAVQDAKWQRPGKMAAPMGARFSVPSSKLASIAVGGGQEAISPLVVGEKVLEELSASSLLPL